MKQKKWIVRALCALFVMLFSMAFAVGCKTNGDGNAVGISLNATELSLDVYEPYQLKSDTENCLWSSSNESVAVVDENGRVVGVSSGVAVVTASIGDATATCVVTVYKSGYAPVLSLDKESVSLGIGAQLSVVPSVTINNTLLTEGQSYQWSFAEGADETIARFSVKEDGSVVLTGLQEGTTSLYVSTSVRNVLLAQKLDVRVVDDSIVLVVANLAGNASYYEAELGLANVAGYMDTVVPQVVVYENGAEVASPALTWQTEGKGIVAEENGSLKAVGVGSEWITVGYKDRTADVLISVVKPVHISESRVEIETYRTTEIALDYDLVGTFESANIDGVNIAANYDGGVVSFNKNALPTSSVQMGAGKVLSVATDKMELKLTVDVYSMIIRSADDLDNMGKAMTVVETDRVWDGYFLLGNDIAYEREYTGFLDYTKIAALNKMAGQFWTNGNENGFKGVFDGQGYNIDGLSVGGNRSMDSVFGVLATGSVIKNLSFTATTLKNDAALICQGGDGRVENVYVQYNRLVKGDGMAMGTFFLRNDYVAKLDENGIAITGEYINENQKARVVNCFVDARGVIVEGADSGVVRLLGTNRYLQMLDNGNPTKLFNSVYLLCDNEQLCQTAIGTNYYNETDCGAYLSFADIRQGKPVRFLLSSSEISNAGAATNVQSQIARWATDDSVWTISNGIPFFKNRYEQLRQTDFELNTTEDVVYAGGVYEVKILGDYVLLSIDKNSMDAGVVLSGAVVTVPAECTVGKITVTATSLISSSNRKTLSLTVRSVIAMSLETESEINLDATIVSGSLTSSSQGSEQISLATLGVEFGSLESVRDGNGNLLNKEKFALSGGDLIIKVDAFDAKTVYGQTSIVVIIGSADGATSYEITVPLFVITKVIRAASEMEMVHANVVGKYINGYYLLGNDIDFTGVTMATSLASAWADTRFQGTFDGRNYTIENYTQTNGGGAQSLFGVIYGGTVKNVNFENVVVNAWNTSGLLAISIRGNSIVENITVKNFSITTKNASGVSGILVGRLIDGKPTFRNIKIYLATSGDLAGFVNFVFGQENQSTSMTLENVCIYNLNTVTAIVKTDVSYNWSGLKIFKDEGETEYQF